MGGESSPGAIPGSQGQASRNPKHLCLIISEHAHNPSILPKRGGGGSLAIPCKCRYVNLVGSISTCTCTLIKCGTMCGVGQIIHNKSIIILMIFLPSTDS